MIVALNTSHNELFEAEPPYGTEDLLRFIQKIYTFGFKALQVDLVRYLSSIEWNVVKNTLDELHLMRNVHNGRLYDAKKFALSEEEYLKTQERIHEGILIAKKLDAPIVSIHPPLFESIASISKPLQLKAQERFYKLLDEELSFARQNHIRIALESFCYPPFIFNGLYNYMDFISSFTREELYVLLDIGHVYQQGIDPLEAIRLFNQRLADVHVHDATLNKDLSKATHLPLGVGTVNFSTIVHSLRQLNYQNFLTLEIRANEKALIQSQQNLLQVLAETP
ncbi:MAG: sugar phosphate isomerase/epimerase family protein [Candidatus Hodarchaeota archaeon]